MKDFVDSFKKGFKISFNSVLGSYFIIFAFFVLGSSSAISIFRNGINFLDTLNLVLCMYNTFWLSELVDLRYRIKKIVFEFLKDSKMTKSDKKFLSDIIFTLNWKNIIKLTFNNSEEEEVYLEKIVFKEIALHAEDKLLERI
jgi:hypothetical protein